jgi:hypothetical protein
MRLRLAPDASARPDEIDPLQRSHARARVACRLFPPHGKL